MLITPPHPHHSLSLQCHLEQPEYLASLADDLVVLQALQQQGDVEGDEGHEVNGVHGVLHECHLVGAAEEPKK